MVSWSTWTRTMRVLMWVIVHVGDIDATRFLSILYIVVDEGVTVYSLPRLLQSLQLDMKNWLTSFILCTALRWHLKLGNSSIWELNFTGACFLDLRTYDTRYFLWPYQGCEQSRIFSEFSRKFLTPVQISNTPTTHYLNVPKLPKDQYGCDGHPNREGHETIATLLSPLITKALGWKEV